MTGIRQTGIPVVSKGLGVAGTHALLEAFAWPQKMGPVALRGKPGRACLLPPPAVYQDPSLIAFGCP